MIDRQNHHCFQPLLYQVATAALSPADVAWPIRHILRKQKNATVLLAEVRAVDTSERLVQIDSVSIPYDYLVLATGAAHSYFGHDEWTEVAPGLKRIEDATRIRRRILIAFERAELATDAAERQHLLTFAIVGGGATGVEMAGAISEVARQSLAMDFRRVDPASARIVLIEAGPRIMPTLPENLSDYVRHTLAKKGVEVITSTRVMSCDAHGVELEHGRLDADTIIWAAGVVASPAARWLHAEHDRAGRVKVGADLSVPGHPEIFVIGDLATLKDENGRLLPGVAPVAMQEGKATAHNIAAELRSEPRKNFHYCNKGNLATIGRAAAVAEFGKIHISGFLAWLAWLFIHIFFLIGFRNRIIVLVQWAWSYFTYERGARLITGDTHLPGWDELRAEKTEVHTAAD